jgi:hypothetical protein
MGRVAHADGLRVQNTSSPKRVTFTFRAPGAQERVEKDVPAAVGSSWLIVSVSLSSDRKGACDADSLALKSATGDSIAAIGISTEPSTGFIKLRELPLGVGRGPSAWGVLRGSSGLPTFSLMESEAELSLLFAVPNTMVPTSVELCSFGSARLPTASKPAK